MNKKQGLQKLTERKKETDRKISELLKLEKINEQDLHALNFYMDEIDVLGKHLTELLETKRGPERDRFLNQIENILTADTKNEQWEVNHTNITIAITNHIDEYGRMPNKTEISKKTNLSRETIYKHLREYSSHPLYAEHIKAYRFIADKLLDRVLRIAMTGDVKAARLYFDVLGLNGSTNTTINTQNNYIQINQTRLSQETIKHLSVDQQNQIEAMLNNFLINKHEV